MEDEDGGELKWCICYSDAISAQKLANKNAQYQFSLSFFVLTLAQTEWTHNTVPARFLQILMTRKWKCEQLV